MSNKRVNPFKLKLHLLECEADEKDKKISDLEARLAESEHRNEQLVDALNGEVFINYKLPMENAQLKQQLAEKKKEISEYVKIVDDLHKQLSDKCDFCDKTHRQNKISFAIQQLEKVKKEFNERKLEYITMETKTHIYGLRIDRINELIDNQIKQLKEMMKSE